MTWPTIFANLAAGNQPLSLFDTMFTQVAQMVAIPSTPSGTNAITLTPIGNAPALPNYQNFSTFRFVAGATTTAAVTAQYQALGLLPVYLSDGVTQAGSGAIVINLEYVLVFAQFLNGGSGGFFLEAASVPAVPPVAGGTITNLFTTNNTGTPNTQVNVTYDELVMNNPTGGALRATSQSFTINAATPGVVNGLDTGALANTTWYHVWGISNGATNGGLLSTSSTTPAMPAGYTFKKRLGAIPTDGSAHFLGIQQKQRQAQYIVGGNGLTALKTIISGTQGNPGTPTYVGTTVNAATGTLFVPPTAIGIGVVAFGSNSSLIAAPNASYGNNVSTTNPPPIVITGGTVISSVAEWWLLEGNQVFFASGGAGNLLQCLGWIDNI